MSEMNRPSSVPDELKSLLTPPVSQGLTVLNDDGIDTRRYAALTREQQIEWLEVNSRRLQEYYLSMTAALAKLKVEQTKEVRP